MRAGSKKNCGPCRNFHQAFHGGLYSGLVQAGLQFVSGGRGPRRSNALRGRLQGVSQTQSRSGASRSIHAVQRRRQNHLRSPSPTSYHSGTRPRRRPALPSSSFSIPVSALTAVSANTENPCQYFCPAAVYEMAMEKDQPKLKINFSNCGPLQDVRHCRPLPDHQLGFPPKAAAAPTTKACKPRALFAV